MTPDELKHIRELCDAATPGPWKEDGFDIIAPKAPTHDSRSKKIVLGCKTDYLGEDDAAFIIAARDAIPKLLDEIERLNTIINEAVLAGIEVTPAWKERRDALDAAEKGRGHG